MDDKISIEEKPLKNNKSTRTRSKPAIIFGYPGIGKSTLALNDFRFVDLESSIFKNENKERDPNWFRLYSEIAINIARQNKIVLMSTHPQTRDYIYKKIEAGELNDIEFKICYPDIQYRNTWIEKVEKRYLEDPSNKNLSALNKVKNDFDKDIRLLEDDNRFDKIKIQYKQFRPIKETKSDNNEEKSRTQETFDYILKNVLRNKLNIM